MTKTFSIQDLARKYNFSKKTIRKIIGFRKPYEESEFDQKLVSRIKNIDIKDLGKRLQSSRNNGRKKRTTEEWKKSLENVLHPTISLENTQYIDTDTLVEVNCENCGPIKIHPKTLKRGGRCNVCQRKNVGNKNSSSKNEFIEKSEAKYPNKFDYSLVDYKSNKQQVLIKCKCCCHQFPVRPDLFLNGRFGIRNECPKCSDIDPLSSGERAIYDWLVENCINFETQKTFDSCKNKKLLPFDFFLPDHNILIEFQGRQHFKLVEVFGGQEAFNEQKKRDQIKKDWVKNSGYQLSEVKFDQDIKSCLSKILPDKNFQEIKDFIDSLNIKYSQKGNRFSIGKYHIQYIKGTECSKFSKNYFSDSAKDLENKGEFTCWIRDFEWENPRKREVLKSYIIHQAGKTPNKWYARNCEVREITPREGVDFEEENCFYGKRGASLRLGLYSKKKENGVPANTLLMIYTFGANFLGKSNDIEVLRVGTRKFSQVIGGASKLLKYFARNYKILKVGKKEVTVDKLKFYCDSCHNKSDSMETIGFEFVKRTPGFMNLFLETGEVKHRQPNKHEEIKKKIEEGKVLQIPIVGTKTYSLDTKDLM